MWHTFWSCLIGCVNIKWIRWVLLKLQSRHDSVHRWTDGQGETSIPPFNYVELIIMTRPQNIHQLKVIAYFLPFVSNKHDDHIGIGVLPSIFKPCCQVVECFAACDVIYKQGASSPTVVRPCDGTEGFLTSLAAERRGDGYQQSSTYYTQDSKLYQHSACRWPHTCQCQSISRHSLDWKIIWNLKFLYSLIFQPHFLDRVNKIEFGWFYNRS